MTVLALSREDARRHPRPLRLIPGVLVIAAVCFNAILAIINAHVTPLGSSIVIGTEVLLVAAAHIVALANFRSEMMPWYALIGILLLIASFRSFVFEAFEAKYLRDVLLIPTFVVLGMTFDERYLPRVIVLITAIVLAVLFIEAIDTERYATLFKVQDYYIDTRGYDAADFWNKQSDLYVSAMRPDSRLFSFIDLHRLSSIFLEPVSLGNYCLIMVAFLCARFEALSLPTRVFLAIGSLAALFGSDGRLAAVSSVLMILVSFIAVRLPKRSAAFYLPAALICALLVADLGGFRAGADDFPGRIAHAVDLLGRFDAYAFLGISTDQQLLSQSVDSGFCYLTLTQSLFGVAALWTYVSLFPADELPEQRRFIHAICIYLAMTMIVSFGFLSIKTAALLWFMLGTLSIKSNLDAASPSERF